MKRGRKTALSFCVLAAFAVAVSCREPTQVTVVISTRQKCSDLAGVQVVVGPNQNETQQRFEQHFTTAVTNDCDASGLVGTLVVTPGGSGATIVVAAGVRVGGAPAPDPTTCADPGSAKGCIVARRAFAFLDHSSLTLPVVLDPLCIGTVCDPASTCFKGACVAANVICNGDECGLPDEHPGEGDAGASEGGSSDGAYDAELDGTSSQDSSNDDGGSMIQDATADADSSGMDANAPPCGSAGSAYCFPNGSTGTSTIGSCSAPANTSYVCCRCTCPQGGVVGCDIPKSASMSMSCHPVCQ
jgi:hypothetical protein